MRLLFVLHTFPPESLGGTELHVQSICDVLAQDHEVRVFCRSADPNRPEGDLHHEVNGAYSITRFNNLLTRARTFESIYLDASVHRAFELELDEFKPDVVHIHHLTSLSTSLVQACRDRRLPVVLSLHDFWMVCPRGQRLTPDLRICEDIDRNRCYTCLGGLWPQWFSDRTFEPTVRDDFGRLSPANLARWEHHMTGVFEAADVILTPSAFHRDRMLERGLPPDRVVALSHGLDHGRFDRPKNGQRAVRVVGYIGSVIPPKGVHVLIDAFRRLDAGEIELHIYGKAQAFHERVDYFRELQSLALGCEAPVRFMGEYDNAKIGQVLANIDILVVPSLWWETFSLTIREAILAGVPVVASDIGAMREAIEQTRAGLCFRAGDSNDLTRTLRRLIDDRELRTRLADRRQCVKTIRKNAEEYLDIYEKANQMAKKRPEVGPRATEFPDEIAGQSPVVRQSPTARPPESGRSAHDPAAVPAVAAGRDVRLSIEKVGSGEVRVASAVEHDAGTRVSFVIGYGTQESGGQVRLVVDFPADSSGAKTSVVSAKQVTTKAIRAVTTSLPQSDAAVAAESSAEQMMRAQSPEHDAAEREKQMYMLDQRVFPEHVKKLDEMVKTTHLSDEDQVIAPSRPAPRRRDDDRTRPVAKTEDAPEVREPRRDRPPRHEAPPRTGRQDEVADERPRRAVRPDERPAPARPSRPSAIENPEPPRPDAAARPARPPEPRPSASPAALPTDETPPMRSVAPRPDLRERLSAGPTDAPAAVSRIPAEGTRPSAAERGPRDEVESRDQRPPRDRRPDGRGEGRSEGRDRGDGPGGRHRDRPDTDGPARAPRGPSPLISDDRRQDSQPQRGAVDSQPQRGAVDSPSPRGAVEPQSPRGIEPPRATAPPRRGPAPESEERRPAPRPAPPRSAPREPAAQGDKEVVWDAAQKKAWTMPEAAAPKPEPEPEAEETTKKTPYNRSGAQPIFQRDDSGSFGEGV